MVGDSRPEVLSHPFSDTGGMCALCDGKSIEQLWQDFRSFIRQGGWALQGVEPSRHGRPWVSSIGLTENYRHPELVAVDDDVRAQSSLLNAIGENVKRGARFACRAGPGQGANPHPVHVCAAIDGGRNEHESTSPLCVRPCSRRSTREADHRCRPCPACGSSIGGGAVGRCRTRGWRTREAAWRAWL